MLRKAQWIVVFGLVAALAGCADDPSQKIVRQLPPPVTPAPRVREASPTPPLLMAPRPLASLRGTKVVIDAGHGGKDPGTKGVSRLPEKSIVLSIANEIARLLQDRGATVICTRTTDRFLELDERAAIAQRNKVNLFVAIHADSAARPAASGSTVYINKSTTGASLSAAKFIQRALASAGIECRGIHRANYRVLVAHSRPAVLVECGYLTNGGDAGHLNTQQYRSKVAAAVARGVADYLAAR
jgi:N-acetylmuramoyl-L-alanine amidase